MMKAAAVTGVIAALVIAPSAASAQPANPGCYGQFVSTGAHTDGGNGAFVSGAATSPEFKGSGNATIGQNGVPVLKAVACGP
jgi:hypothetical protein